MWAETGSSLPAFSAYACVVGTTARPDPGQPALILRMKGLAFCFAVINSSASASPGLCLRSEHLGSWGVAVTSGTSAIPLWKKLPVGEGES